MFHDLYQLKMIVFGGVIKTFPNLIKPYNSFVRIVRGYQSSSKVELKNVKQKVVCSLFKQPLSNKKIIAGAFNPNGEILDLFESN